MKEMDGLSDGDLEALVAGVEMGLDWNLEIQEEDMEIYREYIERRKCKMHERIKPILFNTDMVRAIMDGRKTVTRRLIKPPYFVSGDETDKRTLIVERTAPKGSSLYRKIGEMPYAENMYKIGDILYVRETWCWCPCWDCGMDTDEHNCCDKTAIKFFHQNKKEWGCYGYKASFKDNEYPSMDTWHPSIHMPKEAARIWLKVTDVRVERLQEISHDGALKEGIHHCECPSGWTWKTETDMNNCYVTPIGAMQELWNSTLKKQESDGFGWDANPWVWVIEFERFEIPKEG